MAKTPMRIPRTIPAAFSLVGGLDLVTPAWSIPPGKLFDCQNYEPTVVGGYRRINGYERFDGRPSPSSANYWLMAVALTTTVAVGASISGDTSGAVGTVLLTPAGELVLGRVTGDFEAGEPLIVAALTVGAAVTASDINGSPSPSLDADYKLIAANDLRLDIQAVPGSGPVRGVVVYRDDVYAFRDTADGTAGAIYRATSTGWALVPFGTEIQFTSTTGGGAKIVAGNTIGNSGSPTKTATVIAVLTRAGTWGTDAVGTLIIAPVLGAFANTDPIYVGATQLATATSAATAIARLPGGRLDYVIGNFTGSLDAKKVYGADGVNRAFAFDGVVYVPIRTGMVADTPTHVMFHVNYLFLSFLGSVQHSGVGDPYAWSVVLGADEITCGDPISGFVPQTGNQAGASLAVYTTTGKTFVLYGTGNADFKLVPSNTDLGYREWTMQSVGNDTYGLTGRGVQRLLTTLNYGDFQFGSLTQLIQPLMDALRGKQVASTSLQAKNQYRLYFDDSRVICIGLTGEKPTGITVLNYDRVVRAITTAELSTGEEVTYFGCDDGFVYRDHTGTSFDGEAIEAWFRTVFNDVKSPMLDKRFRAVQFQVKTEGYARVNISYDFGYARPESLPSATQPDTDLLGAGGYWDQFTWDEFTWDAPVVQMAFISLDGTDTNISYLVYSNRAQDKPHTFEAGIQTYTPQRQERP